ncbi:ABC transporter permease [Winogradskyella sp. DF17]|uniref:ABC transporter permease n=1 Tax=Winogradskyella pelagia TaxID=2819984 RepID=A0ABS3SZ12_9FLAO|nr:ABC transporter permease [Winogradskyella sp. DF17]
MNFPLYIAKRYLFSKSSNNAINIMSLIASGGVTIASAALFIVLSVFAGLKTFSLQFTSVFDPDLNLTAAQGKSFFWTEADAMQLSSIAGVSAFSKIVEERVIIKSDTKNLLATLKGVDKNFLKVTSVDSMIKQGQWLKPNSNQVVSGWGISNNLSFGVFDYLKPLSLYVPKPGRGQISSLKSAYNVVYVSNVGLFDVNEELNYKYIFADINLAKSLLSYKENQISSIDIKLNNSVNEGVVRDAINKKFVDRFVIKNRAQLNDSLYKMLNTENLAIYLIFTLVIIIALFNIIGAIIMMILDRKKSLNTLFNLGAELGSIKSIFFLQGSLMTIFSGLFGVTLGVVVVLMQKSFDLVMLTPQLPYPVELKFMNVVIVIVTIVGLGLAASRIATMRITKSLIKP